MMSASPTGPATLSSVPWPLMPIATSAWYTPHTVPNNPRKGAVLPIDASTVRPDSKRAGQKLGRAAGLVQLVRAVTLVMSGGEDRLLRQIRKRFVRRLLVEIRSHGVERRRIPEPRKKTVCAPAREKRVPGFDRDEIPRRHGHDEEQEKYRAADSVGLREEMRKAHGRDCVHESTPQAE